MIRESRNRWVENKYFASACNFTDVSVKQERKGTLWWTFTFQKSCWCVNGALQHACISVFFSSCWCIHLKASQPWSLTKSLQRFRQIGQLMFLNYSGKELCVLLCDSWRDLWNKRRSINLQFSHFDKGRVLKRHTHENLISRTAMFYINRGGLLQAFRWFFNLH